MQTFALIYVIFIKKIVTSELLKVVSLHKKTKNGWRRQHH